MGVEVVDSGSLTVLNHGRRGVSHKMWGVLDALYHELLTLLIRQFATAAMPELQRV